MESRVFRRSRNLSLFLSRTKNRMLLHLTIRFMSLIKLRKVEGGYGGPSSFLVSRTKQSHLHSTSALSFLIIIRLSKGPTSFPHLEVVQGPTSTRFSILRDYTTSSFLSGEEVALASFQIVLSSLTCCLAIFDGGATSSGSKSSSIPTSYNLPHPL